MPCVKYTQTNLAIFIHIIIHYFIEATELKEFNSKLVILLTVLTPYIASRYTWSIQLIDSFFPKNYQMTNKQQHNNIALSAWSECN
jgi:hypothetical protein